MNFADKILLPNILCKEPYYVKEIDEIIYLDSIANRFESSIQSLDFWYGKIQTADFCEQNLLFEADVIKSEDGISLVRLYAMTDDLDALDELEEILADRVEMIVERLNNAVYESVCQAKQIRRDQYETVIF